MMALNITIGKKFRDAFVQKCFRLLIEAYQMSIEENIIQLEWNENDISSEIYRHVKENPLRKIWKISSNNESIIAKNTPRIKGFADKYPRIDFRFATFYQCDEHEYFFEAKRLKQSDSKLKRRYIVTGIDSFVLKKYEQGSLVAYLLEGDADKVISDINTLLVNDNRNSETLYPHTYELFDKYYQSNHPNLGVLKHLVFDFTHV